MHRKTPPLGRKAISAKTNSSQVTPQTMEANNRPSATKCQPVSPQTTCRSVILSSVFGLQSSSYVGNFSHLSPLWRYFTFPLVAVLIYRYYFQLVVTRHKVKTQFKVLLFRCKAASISSLVARGRYFTSSSCFCRWGSGELCGILDDSRMIRSIRRFHDMPNRAD